MNNKKKKKKKKILRLETYLRRIGVFQGIGWWGGWLGCLLTCLFACLLACSAYALGSSASTLRADNCVTVLGISESNGSYSAVTLCD